jgi:hypothetical protein
MNMWKQFLTTTPAKDLMRKSPRGASLKSTGNQLNSWPSVISIGASGGSSAQRGVACSQRERGRFGPRKLRKVAKDTKICLLARLLFVYFVGFRDLRVPNPFPHASDVLAILGGGSSAQRGAACSQGGRNLQLAHPPRFGRTNRSAWFPANGSQSEG